MINDSDNSAKKVFGERASQYTLSKYHQDPIILKRIIELVQPKPIWNMLDLATGTGHTAFAFAEHVHHVLGLDITPEMLQEAEKLKAQYKISNISFRLGSAHQLPFMANEFALITCRRAAHHFAQITIALQEMHRVLKSSGILAIDDRISPEDDFTDKCINELDRLHDQSHVREYRISEWTSMLNKVGFQIVQIEPYTQHRPISSLTNAVDSKNVTKIMHILEGLTDDQQKIMNLQKINGEFYSNHWFAIIIAKKKSEYYRYARSINKKFNRSLTTISYQVITTNENF